MSALDNWTGKPPPERKLEPPKGETAKVELPSLEKWGEYKGYGIWLHPIYGYFVLKEASYAMNKERLDTVKNAQKFIDGLPPHPTYLETLMRTVGHKFK